MSSLTIGQLWRQARDRLAAAGIADASRDAQLLARLAFGLDATQLVTGENETISEADAERLAEFVLRRLAREPVARIAGEKEFYALTFGLNAATLVPRPETELLVDLALDMLRDAAAPVILDLGTGTGCIAISVLVNCPPAQAVATDLSAEALGVARRNAVRHRVAERLELREGDWFSPLTEGESFDIVFSNPPYIAQSEIEALDLDVRRFDPHLALSGGADGLDAYRVIAREAPGWLRPEGAVIVEHGAGQREEVRNLFHEAGFSVVTCYDDLAGHDRALIARSFTSIGHKVAQSDFLLGKPGRSR